MLSIEPNLNTWWCNVFEHRADLLPVEENMIESSYLCDLCVLKLILELQSLWILSVPPRGVADRPDILPESNPAHTSKWKCNWRSKEAIIRCRIRRIKKIKFGRAIHKVLKLKLKNKSLSLFEIKNQLNVTRQGRRSSTLTSDNFPAVRGPMHYCPTTLSLSPKLPSLQLYIPPFLHLFVPLHHSYPWNQSLLYHSSSNI